MTSSSDRNRGTAVRVMLGPHPGWLKVALPATAEVAVVGWIQQTAGIDAEVPSNIAALLSRTLTRSFRVTFLDPEDLAGTEWLERTDRWVRRFALTGWGNLWPSKDLTLVSTLKAEVAETLFSRAGAWNREAQLVLLTVPSALPSALPDRALAALLQKGRLDEDDVSHELLGVMLPGPDGDFAQLAFLRAAVVTVFLEHLENEARCAGIGFEVLSPEEFAQMRWFVEEVER